MHYSFVGQSNAYTLSDIPTLLRLHLHTDKSVGDKWGWCLGACNNTNFVINLGVGKDEELLIEMPYGWDIIAFQCLRGTWRGRFITIL